MTQKTVFISYSHDSEAHREQVLGLSERLRRDGVVTLLDRYINGTPSEGWPRWMLNQLDGADFVLVVCTPTYYRRFRGHEEPGKGKGVDWEGALITQEMYDARSKTLRFVPIFLTEADESCIPEPLRAQTHYTPTSPAQYDSLYDFPLGQAGVEPGPVGVPKIKPRAQGTPLSFASAELVPALGSGTCQAELHHIDQHAPENLIGREAELALLHTAWSQAVNEANKRPRILCLVAMGGEGKTSLVAKWAAELAHAGWAGCDAVFAWSFYSQGTREQTAASSDLFLAEALRFFGDAALAQSNQSGMDKARRLAQLVAGRRTLLILDGLEPLQYAPTSPTPGELRDTAMAVLLKALALNNRRLCVLTTRYAVADLRNYLQTTVLEHPLLRLSEAAGVQLLQSLGVHGAQSELATLVNDVRGHALSLNLLGSYLRDAHGGDVRQHDQVKLEEADAEEQGGHAFRVMDAYVQWLTSPDKNAKEAKRGQRAMAVLNMLGLFDRPASADCLHALLKAPSIAGLTEAFAAITEAQRNIDYTRLEAAKLLTVNRNANGALLSLDAHPLVREYFGKALKTQQPQAWCDAHRRIYVHLCSATKEGKQPTLEDLQPLYQAVVHGCLAGLTQRACDDVYNTRICRDAEAYSTKKLGSIATDLGALACFFESPWQHVSPALNVRDQAWLQNEAAYRLRALGRLGESLEPMRMVLQRCVQQENWNGASIVASNLSELILTLGHIQGNALNSALQVAAQAVVYADRSGDAFLQLSNRATHADALHQAGQQAEARRLFCEAENLQAQMQTNYPLLYSLQGFQYADLLMTQAERAAWRACLQRADGHSAILADELIDMQQRATQTLQWAKDNNTSLLDIALNHLTLGRTMLHTAVLQAGILDTIALVWVADGHIATEINQAVNSMRHAGQQQFIPLALLTRAWLRHLQGHATGPNSAQTDLDEAWEIAERGPMPLFQTDIYLHRARLFLHQSPYPWRNADGSPRSPQDDLAAARQLIFKHGYLRRQEELADAEAAAGVTVLNHPV